MPYTPHQFTVEMAQSPHNARRRLAALMKRHDGDIAKVAKSLGVTKRSVHRYLNRLGLR